ncbi:MAG: succinate--CoA ligase subunit alpha [Chloroflexota bacterium]
MAILINDNTRVIIQGITGKEGAYYTEKMADYHTNIVGGVTPGKGGEWIYGIPIFETVQNAVNATGANTSVIFVPAASAADAIYEAVDSGIRLIVCITEGIPVLDAIRVREYIRDTPHRLIGPNSPGILIPGRASLGIIPPEITMPGEIGVVTRSSTLAYNVVYRLTQMGIGQSAIVGIGGDPVIGTNFVDILSRFEDDPFTRSVVLIGEIGGYAENMAADFIRSSMTKRVVAYIAGQHAPHQRQLGDRGAIVDEPGTDATTKINLLREAGASVVDSFEDIPTYISNN